MPGQRIRRVMLAALLLALSRAAVWSAPAPDIVLPNPLAVELPAGDTSVGADDPALRALLAGAHADPSATDVRVTATLPRSRLGTGVWRVIWSAFHPDDPDHPLARRESWLYVVPHGMVPVGTSGKGNATAGNNAVHIARDAHGFVHMVWTDTWRAGEANGAAYRRAYVAPDGTARFDTPEIPLGKDPGGWTAMPALAVVGDTVHFVWQAGGTVHYRSLIHDGDAWRWSDEVDTKASSPGRDTGPTIVANQASIHILTPGGVYGVSHDDGRDWSVEPVPFGEDQRVKTASLTLASGGRPIAAASSVVIDKPDLSEDRGHGGYWTIRLQRRLGAGAWESLPSPVDGRPEWAAPTQPDQDVLCDWVRVLADAKGGISLAWHGTAVSRIYGNDRAYYAWRGPDGAWSAPVVLREPDPRRGIAWSYAPSLALDGDRTAVLPFYATHVGTQDRGFDSELHLFRDGQSIAPALPVTRFGEQSIVTGEPDHALSAWFPGLPSTLFHDASGRVWADVLVTLTPTAVETPSLIVWDRVDVTDWLPK